MVSNPLTPEERAELRKYVTPPFDIGHGCTVAGGPTSALVQTATVISLLDEIDAQAARIAELEARDDARLEKMDEMHLTIARLEAKVAAQDKTLRSWTGPVAGYAEDPARQLEIAQERIAELEREVAWMKDYERRKYESAAAALGITPPSARKEAP